MAEGIFSISLANPIRFAKIESPVDGDTWDNTLVCAEDNIDGKHHGYAQRLLIGEVIKIYFRSAYAIHDTGLYDQDNNYVGAPVPVLETGPYSAYSFYSVTLDTTTWDPAKAYKLFIQPRDLVYDTQSYMSEPMMAAASWENHVVIRYTNYDVAFELDYANDPGIEHMIRVPGRLYSYKPEGEIEVYSNQGFLTKIREVVQRVQVLETEPIPRWLCEKVNIALAHDWVLVNGVEFVKKSQPVIARFSKTNLMTLTVDLNQRAVYGLNSDDQGWEGCIDPDPGEGDLVVVKNYQKLGATGSVNIDITAYATKFIIDKIIFTLTSGTPTTVKAGWSGGTDEVVFLTDISSFELNVPTSLSVEQVPPVVGGNKVYFTIASGTFTIDMLLIRYKI